MFLLIGDSNKWWAEYALQTGRCLFFFQAARTNSITNTLFMAHALMLLCSATAVFIGLGCVHSGTSLKCFTKSKQRLLFVMLLTPPQHTDRAREHQNTAEQQHTVCEGGREGGVSPHALLNQSSQFICVAHIHTQQCVSQRLTRWLGIYSFFKLSMGSMNGRVMQRVSGSLRWDETEVDTDHTLCAHLSRSHTDPDVSLISFFCAVFLLQMVYFSINKRDCFT